MYSKVNYCFIVFFALVAAWLTPVQSYSQDLSFLTDTTHYLWPTDASPYISSTFGETRSAHFHAGLDIRTWGREGYKVFATRDGIVDRIAISPHGYGKVIFLRHNDDSYSIYAHLNRFEDSLMALADSIRMKDFSFILERNISDKNIRVKQGDVIGYTGSTGVGPPHLHFELRTPQNEPFNPLLTNISIEDNIPPVFSNVAVEHMDPSTYHVTGRETGRAESAGNGYYLGSFQADGPVGITVDVHDRANRTPNVYAVYSLTLVHEQDTLFHSSVDAFSYSNATQMFIDRVFPLLKEQRRGFQRLYRVNGNELTFYKSDLRRGVVDLPEGDHKLKVIASDYYGNQATGILNLEIRNRSYPVSEQIQSIPAYPGHSAEALEHKRTVFAGLNHRTLSPVRLHEQNRTAGPSESETGMHSLIHFKKEEPIKNARKFLKPGKKRILHLPDQTLWIEFPHNALFDSLDAGISIADGRDGLPVIRFEPEQIPLRNKAFVNILLHKYRNSDQPIGLYSYNQRRDRYTLIASGSRGAILNAEITELTDLHIKKDSASPWVGQPTLTENLGGLPVVHVPAVDNLSGIDFLNSKIEVNGLRGITEYDPDKDRLIFYNPDFKPLDYNTVEVWVYDGMGNLSHRVFESIR